MAVITTAQKQKFINDMYPIAHKASQSTKLPETWFIGQWAHETNYGTNTGAKNNNFAGIGAYPGSPYGTSGKKYSSPDAFLTDYLSVINNDRYKGIYSANNVTEFAQALKAGGYATDINYAYDPKWMEVQKLSGYVDTPNNYLTKNLTESDKNFLDNIFKGNKQGIINSQVNGNAYMPALTPEEQLEHDKAEQEMREQTERDEKQEWIDKIFDPIKYGFAIVLIFGLVLFFMYGAFLKDSGIAQKVGNGALNLATGGKAKVIKKAMGGK
jgi:hypothetical protein